MNESDYEPRHEYRIQMTVTLYSPRRPDKGIEDEIRKSLDMADIECRMGAVTVRSVDEVRYIGEDN